MPDIRANGREIRRLRSAANLTVDELVAALRDQQDIERHPDTIRNIELGHTQPGLKLVHAIANVLGVPYEQLLLTEGDDLAGRVARAIGASRADVLVRGRSNA